MSGPADPKSPGDHLPDVEKVEAQHDPATGIGHGHAADLDEKAKLSDYKADAVEAENMEHKMGVLEAVRAYPMAATWALVMSSTIVSYEILLSSLSPGGGVVQSGVAADTKAVTSPS